MKKLKIYVNSFEIPPVGYVDKEGARHGCARAQTTAFKGLKRVSGIFGNRYLSDEERKTLMRVEGFCRNNGLEFEIIDLGTTNLLTKLKLKMKGLKPPTVCCGDNLVYGVPSDKDLKELLRS